VTVPASGAPSSSSRVASVVWSTRKQLEFVKSKVMLAEV
jgi:hypothetical protein